MEVCQHNIGTTRHQWVPIWFQINLHIFPLPIYYKVLQAVTHFYNM